MSDNVVDPDEVTSKSTQTFLSALFLNLAIAGGEFAAFLILRYKFKRIYAGRVDLPPKGQRMKPLPRGLLSIIPAILFADDEQIINFNGLDAYLFVRFLKLMQWIFGPIAVFTWIILLPIYGTSSAGNDGLNMFTYGNIGRDQQSRLAAPLVLVWFSTFFVLFMIKREWSNYVDKRQEFLTSRYWATKAQSRTVLVTGIPDDYINKEALHSMTDFLPGGVRHIWLARDPKELADIYDRNIKATKKLESAYINQIKLANKLVRKKKMDPSGSDALVEQKKEKAIAAAEASAQADTKARENEKKKKSKLGHMRAFSKDDSTPNNDTDDIDRNEVAGPATQNVAARYVPIKKTPTHRLGPIPFFGQKVETIPWALKEISHTNALLKDKRTDLSKYKPKSAAFILFDDQIGAHVFAQCLAHDLPLRMSQRYINVSPKDIIWFTLNINPYSARIRFMLGWAATSAIIIFWSFPTAFVTSISNVTAICTAVHWLNWLCGLKEPLAGIIQGILPPVALALLFMLLPPLLRFLAVFEGIPMYTLVEHSLQRRYFAFLFVQGFIVATLGSGIMASINQIVNSPTSTVQLLAQNLPKASIFFLTLVITSGLSGAAGGFLQIARIIIVYIKIILLGGSPRAIWKNTYTMPTTSWGQTYPAQSLLVVIALAYSTIAPLVCGFALLSFFLWWACWKYLFLWVYDQPPETETGGLFFKTAINQIFAGLYIQHLCLIGLFFLARDDNDNVSGLPEAILMIILLVVTIFVQMTLNSGLSPLSEYLPLSMAQEMSANESKYARQMMEEEHQRRYEESFRSGGGGSVESPETLTGPRFAGASAPKQVESAPAHRLDTPSEYYDAPGYTPRPLEGNEKMLGNTSYPPVTREKLKEKERMPEQEQPYDDQQGREGVVDLEAGDNAIRRQSKNEDEGVEMEIGDELEGGLSENAFFHPALYRPQPTIWLPRDQLGLSAEAVQLARQRGIDITDDDSVISPDKGKITISRDTIPGNDFHA